MTPRHNLNDPRSILRTSFFMISRDLGKAGRVPKGSREERATGLLPSERASTIMRVHVENESFDELEPEISLVKGGPGT